MLSVDDQNILMDIARQSIAYGIEYNRAMPVEPGKFSAALQQDGASFVTLHLNQQLRGCIGSLQAYRPLIKDVSENAFAAAFRDPRFTPLKAPESDNLAIHLSILTPAEPIFFSSEQELLKKIEPGVDGLILEDNTHRGTFLPSVWESLPEPALFLAHLKQKAGLPVNYWSDSIKISRYQTQSFGEE
jgi:AmmeMemoRadiSam system protein A